MFCTPYRTERLAEQHRSCFLCLTFEIAVLHDLSLARGQPSQGVYQHHMPNRNDVPRMVPSIAMGIFPSDYFLGALDRPFLFSIRPCEPDVCLGGMSQEPAGDIVVGARQFGKRLAECVLDYVRYCASVFVPHTGGDVARNAVNVQTVQLRECLSVAGLRLVEQCSTTRRPATLRHSRSCTVCTLTALRATSPPV